MVLQHPFTPSVRLHLAVFLLSLVGLLFQFAQTRLFSATLDYHLTFLVLSGALLGVAGGATLSSVVDGRRRAPTAAQLGVCAALATLAALFVETRIDPIAEGQLTAVTAGYVMGILPALFVSWVIVRALRDVAGSAASLYGADLAGAALGAIVGYLAIGTIGDQGLYGLAAAAALVASALLVDRVAVAPAILVRGVLFVAAATSVVVLSAFGEMIARPLPGPLKAPGPSDVHDLGGWDPLARIDVAYSKQNGDPVQYAFLIDKAFPGPRPPALAMLLDMGALTPIVMGGATNDLSVFDASVIAAPYEADERKSVLIVGPGGGIDILVALEHGADAVTAVEVNRTEVALMRGRYADYSGSLYLDPRVHVFEDEARSFIRRSTDTFDLIPITVVDSFAALSAGAYALSENYLYTGEAMRDYLTHLRPHGVVAMSRWYRDPPVEIIRTLGIARNGLRSIGVTDTASHLAVIRYGNFGTVLVARDAFTADAVARLRTFADAHGFTVELDPFTAADPRLLSESDAAATDDRPFFFDTVPLTDVLFNGAPLPYGYGVLLVTFLISLAFAVGFVLLPVYRGARLHGGSLVPPGTVVALAIGAGFMLAEIVLLQRLTLYLGQPSLALSVGLAALLLGAASGSAVSRRAPGGLRGSALASALLLGLVLMLVPVVTDATLAAPLVARVAVAALIAWLVGLPLGTVFPRLLERIRRVDDALVNWAWAMNGSASVVGASGATALAIAGGFTAVGIAASVCYVLAAVAAARTTGRPA